MDDVLRIGDGLDWLAHLEDERWNEMGTGEWVTRIYASWEQTMSLLSERPRTGGGCKTPMRETATTCVTYSIDSDVARWLRSHGIKLEVIRESEVQSN